LSVSVFGINGYGASPVAIVVAAEGGGMPEACARKLASNLHSLSLSLSYIGVGSANSEKSASHSTSRVLSPGKERDFLRRRDQARL
jgi:hypothetical protein